MSQVATPDFSFCAQYLVQDCFIFPADSRVAVLINGTVIPLEVIPCGDLVLHILRTPGHTPGVWAATAFFAVGDTPTSTKLPSQVCFFGPIEHADPLTVCSHGEVQFVCLRPLVASPHGRRASLGR